MKKVLFLLAFLLPGVASAESFTFGTPPSDTGFSDAYGRTASIQQMGVQFTTTVTANTFDFNFDSATNGSPTDDTVVYIENDLGGFPDGTILGSSAVAASSLSGTCAATVYPTITTASDLPPGTYWAVRGRSGALDNSNNYLNCINHSSMTTTASRNTGTWGTYGLDMVGTLDTSETGGGGGGSSAVWNFSTTTTLVDNPTEQMFDAVVLFLMSMAFVIWLLRK